MQRWRSRLPLPPGGDDELNPQPLPPRDGGPGGPVEEVADPAAREWIASGPGFETPAQLDVGVQLGSVRQQTIF